MRQEGRNAERGTRKAENGRQPNTTRDARIVVEQLERCRGRLRVLAFARYACITVTPVIAAVATCVAVARPGVGQTALLLAGTATAAIIAAALAAIARTPALRATAAALDGRLRLEDRLVTAVQCLQHSDPVARLVVRDASARIADIVPSHVFPFGLPARFRRILAACVGIPALAILVTISAPHPWRIDRTHDVSMAAATAAQQAGRLRAGSTLQAGNAPSGGVSVSPASRDRTGTAELERHSPPGSGPSRASDGADSTSLRRDDAPPTTASSVTTANLGEDGSRAAAATPSATGETSASGVGALRGARNDAAGRLGEAGAPGLQPGRSGGPGGVAAAATLGAGGVKGSPLVETAALPRPDVSRASPTYNAQYRRAWARAEAAIAQERVPADLRAYVKNYFIAIRP